MLFEASAYFYFGYSLLWIRLANSDYCDTVLSKSLERIHSRFVILTPYLVLILLLGLHLLSAADFTWLWRFLNQLISLVLYNYMNDLFTSSVTLTGFSGRNQH